MCPNVQYNPTVFSSLGLDLPKISAYKAVDYINSEGIKAKISSEKCLSLEGIGIRCLKCLKFE
jgi:hypothetical protein